MEKFYKHVPELIDAIKAANLRYHDAGDYLLVDEEVNRALETYQNSWQPTDDDWLGDFYGGLTLEEYFIKVTEMKKVDKGSYHTDRYECELCGHVASYGTMLTHEGGPTCVTKQALNEMDAQQMAPVHSPGVLKAISKAGIEVEKRPARYIYFVPDWVTRAVKAYRGNPTSKYAGMSLSEYLKRMKPE